MSPAVKESITTVWVQLPPPVQQAVPYVGVAVGSGALVFMLQQRRINHANRRGDELNQQVKNLAKEKEELMKRINLLKAKSGTPRTEVEARMASAVAEATNAAAAAADAAARAATACIFQRMPQVPLPPSPQELPKGQGPFLQ
jgi:seryl-tRNA synthetase